MNVLLLNVSLVLCVLLLFPKHHLVSGRFDDQAKGNLDPRLRNLGLVCLVGALSDGTMRIASVTAAMFILFVLVPWLEQRPGKHEEEVREQLFPEFLDLFQMCLAAGLGVADSFIRIERHIKGQLSTDVTRMTELYRLGSPIGDALEIVALEHLVWTRLSEIVQRSAQTGASIHGSVLVISQYLRATQEAQSISKIRALAVKCTLPLGLCFLPAFILLSIVPVVASLFGTLF